MPYSTKKSPHELLGVKPNDNFKTIQRAWRALVWIYHPDQIQGDKTAANAKLADLNAAYEELKQKRNAKPVRGAEPSRADAARPPGATRKSKKARKQEAAHCATAERRARAARHEKTARREKTASQSANARATWSSRKKSETDLRAVLAAIANYDLARKTCAPILPPRHSVFA